MVTADRADGLGEPAPGSPDFAPPADTPLAPPGQWDGSGPLSGSPSFLPAEGYPFAEAPPLGDPGAPPADVIRDGSNIPSGGVVRPAAVGPYGPATPGPHRPAPGGTYGSAAGPHSAQSGTYDPATGTYGPTPGAHGPTPFGTYEPAAGPYVPLTDAPQPPRRGTGRTSTIVATIACLAVVIAAGVYFFSAPNPEPPVPPSSPPPTTSPTARPSISPTDPPSTTPSGPASTPTPKGPLGEYRRERERLTPLEREAYGGLRKGDCLNEPGDFQSGVTTVDCSTPHTDQVMGFVDLSEDMPDRADGIQFEIAVAQRCNSLRDTLPIPEGFAQGVRAAYPDVDEWAAGVRVALCWVPVFHKTWVGSAIDGTAREV